jgi:hypothetical protein
MLVLLRDIGEMKKADELRKDLTAMLVHDLLRPWESSTGTWS